LTEKDLSDLGAIGEELTLSIVLCSIIFVSSSSCLMFAIQPTFEGVLVVVEVFSQWQKANFVICSCSRDLNPQMDGNELIHDLPENVLLREVGTVYSFE